MISTYFLILRFSVTVCLKFNTMIKWLELPVSLYFEDQSPNVVPNLFDVQRKKLIWNLLELSDRKVCCIRLSKFCFGPFYDNHLYIFTFKPVNTNWKFSIKTGLLVTLARTAGGHGQAN